jgi:D-3-phosphoglycerate dehydrogenase / 2-oxoglutarate reductase
VYPHNRVLICDSIDNAGIESLKKSGMVVEYQPEINLDQLRSIAKNYDVLIVRSRTKITKDIIEASTPHVKIIARVGVGLDNIDVEEAKARNIQVINSPEAAVNAVSELVIGLILSLARSIPFADAETKKGNWIKKDLTGIELRGKYLGIIGVGNIGRNIGRIGRALRMNIIGYDIVPIDKDFVKEVGLIVTDLNTLLESSDFITCHVPLTAETKKMFNREKLSKMKSTAFLVNTSRGEVIDEGALYDALSDGRIAGAALDVFETEPPTSRMLVQLQNVVCTPHIGAQTKEAQELAAMVIAEKIVQNLREIQMGKE